MKTYRQHNCSRKHRTFKTFAECVWKGKSPLAGGDGAYASVSTCNLAARVPSYRQVVTVALHSTPEAAERAKSEIDSTGCGGFCHGQHEVALLDLGRA